MVRVRIPVRFLSPELEVRKNLKLLMILKLFWGQFCIRSFFFFSSQKSLQYSWQSELPVTIRGFGVVFVSSVLHLLVALKSNGQDLNFSPVSFSERKRNYSISAKTFAIII